MVSFALAWNCQRPVPAALGTDWVIRLHRMTAPGICTTRQRRAKNRWAGDAGPGRRPDVPRGFGQRGAANGGRSLPARLASRKTTLSFRLIHPSPPGIEHQRSSVTGCWLRGPWSLSFRFVAPRMAPRKRPTRCNCGPMGHTTPSFRGRFADQRRSPDSETRRKSTDSRRGWRTGPQPVALIWINNSSCFAARSGLGNPTSRACSTRCCDRRRCGPPMPGVRLWLKAQCWLRRQRSPATTLPLVDRLASYLALSEAEIEFLGELHEPRRKLRRHREVIVAGRRYEHLFILCSGVVSRYKVLQDGKRQVLNLGLPGDLIGLPSCLFDVAVNSVSALTDVVLSPVPFVKLFSLFARFPRVATALFWSSACRCGNRWRASGRSRAPFRI